MDGHTVSVDVTTRLYGIRGALGIVAWIRVIRTRNKHKYKLKIIIHHHIFEKDKNPFRPITIDNNNTSLG